MLFRFTNTQIVVGSEKLTMGNKDTVGQCSHSPSAIASNIANPHDAGEWYCSSCGYGPHNPALHTVCIMCGALHG